MNPPPRKSPLFNGLLAILGSIGVLGALVVVACRRNLLRAAQRVSSVVAATAMLLCALTCSGCGLSSDSTAASNGIVVDQESYDHGMIDADERESVVNHEFVLTNKSETAVVLTVAASCSCVTPALKDSTVELLPHASVGLPVSIDLKAKVEAFKETVWLKFKNGTVPDRSLEILGFVCRMPLAATNPLKLIALAGKEQSQTLEVVYTRTREQAPAELDNWRVLDSSSSAADLFLVDRPTCRSGIAFGGNAADIWSFPITFRNSSGQEEVAAQLELKWKSPPCATVVQLVGKSRPPVEMVSKVLIRDSVVGVEQTQTVPIRINSREIAAQITVVSPYQVQCEILNEPDRLSVALRPDQAGEFRYPVSFWLDDDIVTTIELFGTAKGR